MTKHHNTISQPAPPGHAFNMAATRTEPPPSQSTLDAFAQVYLVDFSMSSEQILFALYAVTALMMFCWCFSCLFCCVPERFKKAIGAATLVLGLSAFVATVILTDRMEQAVIHARHFAHKTSRIWALATGPIEEVH